MFGEDLLLTICNEEGSSYTDSVTEAAGRDWKVSLHTRGRARFKYLEPGQASAALKDCSEQLKAGACNHYACTLVQDTGPHHGEVFMCMVVAFNVPAALKNEVDRWYLDEHIPLLMHAQHWLRARRYVVEDTVGQRPFTSIAVHELANEEVLNSEERKHARSTEWRANFSSQEWFKDSGRYFYLEKPNTLDALPGEK